MDELKQIYRDAMPSIGHISAQYDAVSGPLLMTIPCSYVQTRVRLMVIGQQTYGWPSVTVELEELLRTYKEFDLGREYYSSPFWQASHQVFRSANPDGPERAFLWSNLVRVDQNCKRPCAEIENAVSDLGLLNRELHILEPDAAVFFTGPHYDRPPSPNVPRGSVSRAGRGRGTAGASRLACEIIPNLPSEISVAGKKVCGAH